MAPRALPGLRAREPAGRAADGVEDVAEKLLELLLVRHLEQPRGELELLRLVQRHARALACSDSPNSPSSVSNSASFQLHRIDVVHRHLRATVFDRDSRKFRANVTAWPALPVSERHFAEAAYGRRPCETGFAGRRCEPGRTPSCSRYFATVRRASTNPRLARSPGELGVGLRALLGREQARRVHPAARSSGRRSGRTGRPGRTGAVHCGRPRRGSRSTRGHRARPRPGPSSAARQLATVANEPVLPADRDLRDPAHRSPALLEPIDELSRRDHLTSDRLALLILERRGRGPFVRRADNEPEAVPLDQFDREPVSMSRGPLMSGTSGGAGGAASSARPG